MDFSSLLAKLERFETERVMQYLGQLDVGELVRNPVLLGIIGVLALVALVMRWRVLLVTIVGLTGFVWLVAHVQQRGTELQGGMTNESLLLFIGGGVAIVAVIIYFLFIRTE